MDGFKEPGFCPDYYRDAFLRIRFPILFFGRLGFSKDPEVLQDLDCSFAGIGFKNGSKRKKLIDTGFLPKFRVWFF
jgi:hypothetical protein